MCRLRSPRKIQTVVRQKAEGMALHERCKNHIYLSDVRMLVKGRDVLERPLLRLTAGSNRA